MHHKELTTEMRLDAAYLEKCATRRDNDPKAPRFSMDWHALASRLSRAADLIEASDRAQQQQAKAHIETDPNESTIFTIEST